VSFVRFSRYQHCSFNFLKRVGTRLAHRTMRRTISFTCMSTERTPHFPPRDPPVSTRLRTLISGRNTRSGFAGCECVCQAVIEQLQVACTQRQIRALCQIMQLSAYCAGITVWLQGRGICLSHCSTRLHVDPVLYVHKFEHVDTQSHYSRLLQL
jgi:hypothetical protein